jgi:hypothetical protein
MVNGKELYDLEADPAESRDLSKSQPGRLAEFNTGYEAWFRDVASTRNFEPPRIYLGTAHENPVLLTRQDWRGPQASWAPGGLGYWEVDVRQAGDYELTLIFPAAVEPGQAWATLPPEQHPLSSNLTLCQLSQRAPKRGSPLPVSPPSDLTISTSTGFLVETASGDLPARGNVTLQLSL